MYEERINYLKQCVSKMRKRDRSTMWGGVLSLFDYINNLSPQDFLNIRLHSGYITGGNILQHYYQYPRPDPDKYADSIGYKFLTEDIPEEYWISEPLTPAINGLLGVEYKGRIINQDIARYQTCISNLYSTGILSKLKDTLTVEIGGGYGGLAHYLGNITKGTYIIVDLPEMLLFSGGFLIVNNPDKRIYIYDEATFTKEFMEKDIYYWDYVLLPNYILNDLYALRSIGLFVNMQSFQEMTIDQVSNYLRFAKAKLDGVLYSDNVDRHPHNEELDSVGAFLSAYFELFPSQSFYDFGKDDPWLYKIFMSSTQVVHPNMQIKFIHWMTNYTLTLDRGTVKYKKSRTVLGSLIVFGLKVLRVAFRL